MRRRYQQLAALAYGHTVAHQAAEARKYPQQLKERSEQTYVQPLALAVIHIGLGNGDEAFDWLGKALASQPQIRAFPGLCENRGKA
jgi:hypothetical protein